MGLNTYMPCPYCLRQGYRIGGPRARILLNVAAFGCLPDAAVFAMVAHFALIFGFPALHWRRKPVYLWVFTRPVADK